jgi:hypothetical protein
MTDIKREDLRLPDEDMDDLNRRLSMAESRLNAVRSHRLTRQHESLELLSKIEERFVQQRNELLQAQDHIRRVERVNRELKDKLRRLVSAVEAGMDAADDIFYRMVNVTNEISSFSNQSLSGEYRATAMLDGLDIEGEAAPRPDRPGEAGPRVADAPAPAPAAASDRQAVAQRPAEQAPATSMRPATDEAAADGSSEEGAQVLDIKAIFAKG